MNIKYEEIGKLVPKDGAFVAITKTGDLPAESYLLIKSFPERSEEKEKRRSCCQIL